ncbi:MAG: deoxyhypusine synthase family protein [Myxococcales bacterium]|nr:deoxyhypusine synthase family protein [Myxococcales bacterium]
MTKHDQAAAAERTKRALAEQDGIRPHDRQVDVESLGLSPTRSLDLAECQSFSELLTGMRDTSFGGRQLGEAADVLEEMVRDEDCLVIGTFSGAMTVAKQGLLLCDMIDHGMLDVVVSTGALMTHGLIEATGLRHFKVPTDMTDRQLYYAGLDRVYDTLELEENLDDLESWVREILRGWPDGKTACSRTICAALGEHLEAHAPGRGILKSALRRGVPVYIPAFTDSELGLDFALHNRRRRREGRPTIPFDPFLDLEDYTERVSKAERLGIFTVGGGVPRNWAQQVSPYIDLIRSRAEGDSPGQRFRYGVRLCPEPVHWGGLSGCTYSEGVSWGKFVPPADGGRFAEVAVDATIAWPLLLAGVLERLGAGT